ncbi:hypothetical protein [Novosphingobium sp. KN65.2]|uniref:hypothetical protein n=1 Tax=Novosphingobium sp. KN65.2 TaxID=1478134 RepID=UPI0006D56D01|nr:hypothetical protein [Novosphingobium sp. KN65.2]
MYRMLVDYNERIKKGDLPPAGLEEKFVKAGLAVRSMPKKPAVKRKVGSQTYAALMQGSEAERAKASE